MYQYKDEEMNVTTMLGHVTNVYYKKGAHAFYVYSTDNEEPNEVPARYYDDFMNKLNLYVKSQTR